MNEQHPLKSFFITLVFRAFRPSEWDVSKVGWYKHHPHLGFRYSHGFVHAAFEAKTLTCSQSRHDWSFRGNYFQGAADSLLSSSVSVQDLYRHYLNGQRLH